MTSPVALVTGASRGIGRAIALGLAQSGFDLVVNYVTRAESALEVVKEIEGLGQKAIAISCNVSQRDDRDRLLKDALKELGHIDLLVNNAGIAPLERVDLLETGEASFDAVMTANLKGPFFLSQAVSKQILIQEPTLKWARGVIINVSSISAYTSSTNRGEYCLSKAAMSMMTSLFADRLAPEGVMVYEIRPGVIATDMTGAVKQKYDDLIEQGLTPIRRWGKPEDVAKAVVMLAQGALAFSPGQRIDVDGGFHIRRL